MPAAPPELLPIFRSTGQARLLARVYLGEPDATLADLARELDLDSGGLSREADRLERAGLIRSNRFGRNRVLSAGILSPYYPELYGLLLKAYGPLTIIGPSLRSVEGVERAYLYGSWAERYLGEPGPDPADIDVVVIGRPRRMELSRVSRELSPQLAREANIVAVSRDEWDAAETVFVRTIKEGALVEIELNGVSRE